MIQNILEDLIEKINKVSGLRYCGEDWGQLNFEQPPVDFPCALVDIMDAGYTSQSKGVQTAEITISVTVADIRYNGITANLPARQAEQEFSIFTLIENVNRQIHGHGGVSYNRLSRASMKKILREDSIREFLITYKTSYTDSTAKELSQEASDAKPRIKIKAAE
jgi:hypothetical protein bfra3_07107|nr:MAG TPA: hypothetical protein [Caudoviricetes sp.]